MFVFNLLKFLHTWKHYRWLLQPNCCTCLRPSAHRGFYFLLLTTTIWYFFFSRFSTTSSNINLMVNFESIAPFICALYRFGSFRFCFQVMLTWCTPSFVRDMFSMLLPVCPLTVEQLIALYPVVAENNLVANLLSIWLKMHLLWKVRTIALAFD